MDLQEIVPLVIYDNQCYLCIKFANTVNFLARGKIALVGHYTELGEELKKEYDDTFFAKIWYCRLKPAKTVLRPDSES